MAPSIVNFRKILFLYPVLLRILKINKDISYMQEYFVTRIFCDGLHLTTHGKSASSREINPVDTIHEWKKVFVKRSGSGANIHFYTLDMNTLFRD